MLYVILDSIAASGTQESPPTASCRVRAQITRLILLFRLPFDTIRLESFPIRSYHERDGMIYPPLFGVGCHRPSIIISKYKVYAAGCSVIRRLWLGRVGIAARPFACVVVNCVVGATLSHRSRVSGNGPSFFKTRFHCTFVLLKTHRNFAKTPAGERATTIDNDVVQSRAGTGLQRSHI